MGCSPIEELLLSWGLEYYVRLRDEFWVKLRDYLLIVLHST